MGIGGIETKISDHCINELHKRVTVFTLSRSFTNGQELEFLFRLGQLFRNGIEDFHNSIFVPPILEANTSYPKIQHKHFSNTFNPCLS
jgi:hypothetical protein